MTIRAFPLFVAAVISLNGSGNDGYPFDKNRHEKRPGPIHEAAMLDRMNERVWRVATCDPQTFVNRF